jgi:hypothetical protein
MEQLNGFVDIIKEFFIFLKVGMAEYLLVFNIHYIMAFIVLLIGLKYTDNLEWYKMLYGKYKRNVIAITGFILMLFYMGMSPQDLNLEYIGSLLQSYILTLVFQDMFIVLFGFFINKITFNYIKFDHSNRSINFVQHKKATENVVLDKGKDNLES